MKNFTRVTALVAGLLLTAGAAMAQTTTYNTMGVIGPGSPGGDWNSSNGVNSLTKSSTNANVWTATLTMKSDQFKFRANDNWGGTSNGADWGGPSSGAWPAATALQGGAGSNITAVAGRYNVTFNSSTGAYSFTAASATRDGNMANMGLSLLPNPATEAISINYSLPASALVSLTVYNSLGQVARQLPTQRQAAGQQEQQIAHLNLAPGIYVVRLQADDQFQAARLLVQ